MSQTCTTHQELIHVLGSFVQGTCLDGINHYWPVSPDSDRVSWRAFGAFQTIHSPSMQVKPKQIDLTAAPSAYFPLRPTAKAMLQIRIVVSSLPEAMALLSGEKAMAAIPAIPTPKRFDA